MIPRQGPKYLEIVVGDYTGAEAEEQAEAKEETEADEEAETSELKICKTFDSNGEIEMIDSKVEAEDPGTGNTLFARYKMPCCTRVEKENLVSGV